MIMMVSKAAAAAMFGGFRIFLKQDGMDRFMRQRFQQLLRIGKQDWTDGNLVPAPTGSRTPAIFKKVACFAAPTRYVHRYNGRVRQPID
jgi:hypothetical protein